MTYNQARSQSAYIISCTNGGKIRANADDEMNFYRSVIEYGGYGIGARTSWIFKNSSTARRLGDRLVGKGLLVKVEQGNGVGYQVPAETQETFDRYVAHFEAENQAIEDKRRQAEKAAQAARKFVVVVVDTRTGGSWTVDKVFTDEGGEFRAQSCADIWTSPEGTHTRGIVVELES